MVEVGVPLYHTVLFILDLPGVKLKLYLNPSFCNPFAIGWLINSSITGRYDSSSIMTASPDSGRWDTSSVRKAS